MKLMSSENGKARETELVEDEHPDSGSEGSDEEVEVADTAAPQASTPSTSSKKKKKKRSKALKALSSLGGGKGGIPQDLVNVVLEKVKETGDAPGADEATVRAALEQMKIKDVIQGKAGIGGRGKKDTGGHKVDFYHYSLRFKLTTLRRIVLGNAARTSAWCVLLPAVRCFGL